MTISLPVIERLDETPEEIAALQAEIRSLAKRRHAVVLMSLRWHESLLSNAGAMVKNFVASSEMQARKTGTRVQEKGNAVVIRKGSTHKEDRIPPVVQRSPTGESTQLRVQIVTLCVLTLPSNLALCTLIHRSTEA